MTATHDTASLRAGAGLGVAAAVMMTAGALLIPGPVAATQARAAEPVTAAATDARALDRAIDANIAEVKYFIDLGGALDRSADGTVILDARGSAATTGLRQLAEDLAASLAIDPAVVEDAIAAAGGAPVDVATGLATGTARNGGVEVICTESHGGISLGFAPVRA
ncbi:hypothetical protein [Demequina silvatica]|uniref:hypothetical protein n=1 Tax=Demequina silvatica TaxID=1638988 RepID=UPI0007816F1E|nr:hypothetical protein [Demequina silvatica]